MSESSRQNSETTLSCTYWVLGHTNIAQTIFATDQEPQTESMFFSNDTIKEAIKGATETLEIGEIWMPYSVNKALTQLFPRAFFWKLRCHQHLLVYG